MRFILLAIQMIFLALPLWALDPLSRYVDAESLGKLRAGATISAGLPADGSLALVPAVASRARISSDVKALRLTVGVELLSIIGGLPGRQDSPEGWLKIYNALHAVSSMKGLTYWSVTRGSRQVLFTQSYAITSAQRQERIADPVFSELPPDDVLYTVQEDRSFGRGVYEESFTCRADHLEVRIENLTTISFMLLPLIQPRNLASYVVLVPAGNDILFYGLAYIRTSMPIGDRHGREESLMNRLVAIADWLKTRVVATNAP